MSLILRKKFPRQGAAIAIAVALMPAAHAPLVWAQDASHAHKLAQPAVQPAVQHEAELAKAIEAALAPHFNANEPGATVIVTRNGKTLYRRAFGMADVDAKTPLKPDDVLRLGSLTKQFTAVATLILIERGRIALNDPITKHLTDYPKTGDEVTIEHLLTHTSGIPSYTNSPDYMTGMARAVTVNEMIARFKDKPLEFKPGSKWQYNNSGYFLLGAIIEKVSGMSYADFVAKEIFIPLGMNDASYEGVERSAKRIVKGYSDTSKLAAPLHMSQPYAAGSLIATVDDLAKWDAAISAGKLLKPESWKRAFTAYTLADGSKTTYGYGWGMNPVNGVNALMHSGGINGFTTFAIHVPQANVYAAMLFNRSGGAPGSATPGHLTEKITAIAMGKPYPEFKPVALDAAALDKHIGVYRVDDKTTRTITREGNQLFVQRTGGGKIALQATSPSKFYRPNTFTTFTFDADAHGETTRLVVSHPSGDETSPRISKTPPPEKKAIALAPEVFDRYVGVYTIRPSITMTVSREGDKFITQVTGQGKIEIGAETEELFFAKVMPAQIRFDKDASGKYSQLTILQNGRETPAKREP